MRASRGRCSKCGRSCTVGCVRPAYCDNCKQVQSSDERPKFLPGEIKLEHNFDGIEIEGSISKLFGFLTPEEKIIVLEKLPEVNKIFQRVILVYIRALQNIQKDKDVNLIEPTKDVDLVNFTLGDTWMALEIVSTFHTHLSYFQFVRTVKSLMPIFKQEVKRIFNNPV